MTQVEAQHKKSHQQHQNCQNCIRQKKQNQTWIKIYQRLQDVQKNTQRISNAVKEHKLSSDTNRSFYKSYEQKIVSLPKVKREVNSLALQNLGFQVAIGILQKQTKNKLIQESNRLKKELNQIRKQRWEEPPKKMFQSMNSSYFSEKKEDNGKLDQTIVSLGFKSTNFRQSQSEVSQKIENRNSEEMKQNSSTQSTSFNIRQTKNTFDLSRYNDLNLWLYQNDKHSKLQEDLFAPRQATKNSSFLVKRTSQILPSIRSRK